MDSQKINMVAGGLLGSLLVFLLLGFFSDLIYVGRGHHDEPLAFAVEVEESSATEAAAGTVDIAALIASADAAEGEKLFKKCSACHKVEDGANGVGPHLYGVVGRPVASVSGYAYSGGLTGMGGTWDLETLMAFLESPKGMVADTKMSFKGMPDAEDRVNLITFLNEADGSPEPLQ